MVSTGTGWSLIVAGAIIAVIFGIAAYGYIGPIPAPLTTVCMLLFWIGIALLIIGIIVLVVALVRKTTGT